LLVGSSEEEGMKRNENEMWLGKFGVAIEGRDSRTFAIRGAFKPETPVVDIDDTLREWLFDRLLASHVAGSFELLWGDVEPV
jgi:hypothetical protein